MLMRVPAAHACALLNTCITHVDADRLSVACLPQARLTANRHELEALQAAVGIQAAAAAAGVPPARRGENSRRAFKAPAMPIMPLGYDPADTVLFQQQVQRRALTGAAAAAPIRPLQQQQHGQMRSYDFGQMMAQMLLSVPMGRAGRATGGQARSSAARRGLPAGLVHMREAVLGMQRAGLPPHMLFSDRDFTAGTIVGRQWFHGPLPICGWRQKKTGVASGCHSRCLRHAPICGATGW